MAGSVPIRVACFLMCAACGALCQQRQEDAAISLPDAPPVQASSQQSVDRGAQVGYLSFSSNDELVHDSGDFITRHLYPTPFRRNPSFHPATSGSVMGRATFAASRTFITREESGKAKLNTSYFLRVLGFTALHTASVPYWRRSTSAPFSDFGSTIGNDAGMNVLHEFEPGIEKLLKSHTPKFVSTIEEHIGHK